jgi:DNA-binding transcriptional MocR family regulator
LSRSTAKQAVLLDMQTSDQPLHERLAETIKSSIAEGVFRPGDRLPAHRELSRQFNVAIGTVTRAIEALSREGIVRGEVGRGTFVAVPEPAQLEQKFIDMSINALPNLISPTSFESASERACRRVLQLPFGGYFESAGHADQREILASWLARARLPVARDDLIVTVGAQHGISLAFAELKSITGAIATEPATFTCALAAARSTGLDLVPIAVDQEGMLPDALSRAIRQGGIRAVYTIPVCHSPLGFETGLERRQAIVEICARHQVMIVEDDVYGVFGTAGIPTYKELAPDLVYYVNGLSKTLTPLMRVGVLIPPKGKRQAISERLRAELWSPPALTVAMACELLVAGEDAKVESWMKEEAKARLELARQVLGDALPTDTRIGPHLWLPMPLLEAERVARQAVEQGVRLTPPSALVLDPDLASGIRVCILSQNSRAVAAAGIRLIAQVLSAPEDVFI